MIFKSLTVISLSNKQTKNYYEFNPVGLNLILGEKNEENDETNGVGKTALIESIQYCLGAKLPKSFKDKEVLQKEDIFIVLAIDVAEKTILIGRLLSDDSFAYILESADICYELQCWDALKNDDFRRYIQNKVFCEFKGINLATAPSFSAIRELIMRDEKTGYTGITIQQRKASTINQIISFLSLLPCNYENNILQQKNIIKEIEAQLRDIKLIGKEIDSVRSKYETVTKEIDELKNILSNANVSKKLGNDEQEYDYLKSQLCEINIQIRKLEFAQKQHQENILDLENNLSKVNEYIDLKDFYIKSIGYFPDVIMKNYQEMQEFYQFMIGNRGEYIRKQLQLIEDKLSPLYIRRDELLEHLAMNTHFVRNSTLVKDLHEISNQIADKYKLIAEYEYKIQLYSKKPLIEADKKKQMDLLNILVNKYKLDYENHKDSIQNICTHFQKLNEITYQTSGVLSYEFEDSVKSSACTGRINVKCNIEDEDAHGRFFMKINMFDLSMLLNRVDSNQGITFLFHDGSYSKPSPVSKEKLLPYIDRYLKSKGLGQYFVTINVEELSKEAISLFNKNNNIVTKLQRTDSNTDRFMGIKY